MACCHSACNLLEATFAYMHVRVTRRMQHRPGIATNGINHGTHASTNSPTTNCRDACGGIHVRTLVNVNVNNLLALSCACVLGQCFTLTPDARPSSTPGDSRNPSQRGLQAGAAFCSGGDDGGKTGTHAYRYLRKWHEPTVYGYSLGARLGVARNHAATVRSDAAHNKRDKVVHA